jgi:small conductance mechanosensitive channel
MYKHEDMKRLTKHLLFVAYFLLVATMGHAQTLLPSPQTPALSPTPKETQPAAPEKIDVTPTARDDEIRDRLQGILETTGWFKDTNVRVKEGVVFLNGVAKSEEFKKWAGDLARNTQDVSAVVNKIAVKQPSLLDFAPILLGMRELWNDLIRVLPALIFALLIFILTWLIAKLLTASSKKLLQKRIPNDLLLNVIAHAVGFGVFVFGFYIIFKTMGLTTVALTILGGTGVLGIILGIAFRDLVENVLASILLSIHQPFHTRDLIEVEGAVGYVQRLTLRSTFLMSLEGNILQIPNATIFKGKIRNYSANPNRQESFEIYIGYEELIPQVQEHALKVLEEHPAVLKDPEPWVLVDRLEKAAVILRVYFWLDGSTHSWLKVRSSVIRLVKRKFQSEGISMPGDVHEISFTKDVPVRLLKEDEKAPEKAKAPVEAATIATTSEAGLSSDSQEIEEQARQARPPGEKEVNLLNHTPEEK